MLINLKFVATEFPVVVNRPKRKNFVYKITDNFFSFWLNYVYPFKDDIEIGEIEHLKRFFRKDYDRYAGIIFEKICKQIAQNLKLPLRPTNMGRWWYKEKEIDLICLDDNKKEALFIEVKWSELKKQDAVNILTELKEKSKFFEWSRRKEYFGLIGKKVLGKEKLRENGFFIFDLEDIKKLL